MEEDVTKDLAEFSIANAIYAALVEGHAAEISSKSVPSTHALILHLRILHLGAMLWTMRRRCGVFPTYSF